MPVTAFKVTLGTLEFRMLGTMVYGHNAVAFFIHFVFRFDVLLHRQATGLDGFRYKFTSGR
jgi:hypothetical protein